MVAEGMRAKGIYNTWKETPMKHIILAGSILTALIAMPQFVTAAEKDTESTTGLYAMAQIEQTLPELSDQELAKVEGQAPALVNNSGPSLVNVQANANLKDTVDINNNDVQVTVAALGGGALSIIRN
jgi:hypothetical protein